jgi:RsiW-degrading membrane proteinase PrsW (M82 family)
MESNILEMIMAVLPVFLYSILVYYMIPNKFVSQRRARRYFVVSLTSPTIVYVFNYIFPTWSTQILSNNPLIVFGYQSFIQIGLVEETAKFLTFWWVFSQRRSSIHDLPIATMYYCMMASGGFALIENISYLMNYGDGVLFTRAISAIILHMICGIIMGFYIQKAFSVKNVLIEKESLFEGIKPDFHKWKFILTGIIVSTIFHGIYDMNLFLPFNVYSSVFLCIILFFGLFIGKFMIDEAIRKSVEIRNKNFKKDLEHF